LVPQPFPFKLSVLFDPFIQQPVHQGDNSQSRQADKQKDHQQAPEHAQEKVARHAENINDQGSRNEKAQQKDNQQPATPVFRVKNGFTFPGGWTFLSTFSHHSILRQFYPGKANLGKKRLTAALSGFSSPGRQFFNLSIMAS
jgi:hypothetical protein